MQANFHLLSSWFVRLNDVMLARVQFPTMSQPLGQKQIITSQVRSEDRGWVDPGLLLV